MTSSDSSAVDYRVSRLIVLCKDCGDDVGLYPSRHKCRTPDRPPLPTLVVPKEEQATYWEMLKSTLWTAEGSTAASDESPGGLIWNKMREATTTVAKVVGVATADESDSDEDENGETKVTRELKAYYEKKGEGIPDFLLTKKRESRRGSRTEDRNRNMGGQTRGRVVKKAPIPIRKAPLREEDDEQEQMRQREREQAEREKEQAERELERERRREKEQAERERARERRRAEQSDLELDEERMEEERKLSEREAALAALDGKRSSTSSTASGSSRRGASLDPQTERSPSYNETPPQRQRPPQAQYRPTPPVNERSRMPVPQPQRYNQQPTYRRAPPRVANAPPPRTVLRTKPPTRTQPGGSFAPPQMRSNMPNVARRVDPRVGTARRLRGDGDPRIPLQERSNMMDPRQPEARFPARNPSRNGPRMAAGSQGSVRMNQGVRRAYEERY